MVNSITLNRYEVFEVEGLCGNVAAIQNLSLKCCSVVLKPCVCYGSRILRLLHFICVTFSSFCFCLLFRGFFSLSWFCCFTVAAFIFYFFCSLKQVCVTFLLPPGIKGLTCRRNKIKRLQYLEYVASPFF